MVNSRSRSRFGSHLRASWLVRASICSQAVSSTAICTMAHQIWFWLKPCRGHAGQAGVLRDADPVFGSGLAWGQPVASPATSTRTRHRRGRERTSAWVGVSTNDPTGAASCSCCSSWRRPALVMLTTQPSARHRYARRGARRTAIDLLINDPILQATSHLSGVERHAGCSNKNVEGSSGPIPCGCR